MLKILLSIAKSRGENICFSFKQVGKYYWSKSTIYDCYKPYFFGFLLIEGWTIINGYIKMIDFLEKDKLIRECVKLRNLRFLKYIIKKYNSQKDKNFALSLACELNDINIVKFLLKENADVNYDDIYPLRITCYNGSYDIVKLLLQNGASINCNFVDMLSYCSYVSYTSILKLLFRYKKFSNEEIKYAISRLTRDYDHDKSMLLHSYLK